MTRPFRFGAQAASATSHADWIAAARRAENLGYSTLFVPDHLDDQLAPVPALAAAAEATSTIRIGSLVFDNDFRHPLLLAKEAATLDLLSDGRLELGLGAGWMRWDYEWSGIRYDPPAVRVERFEEALAVVKGLLSGEPFSFSGRYYTITEHTGSPRPVQRPHPPILVGGGGRRLLSIAARQADIVGINPNLGSGVLESEAAIDAGPERMREKVAWVREAAGDRFDSLELNTLISFAILTDDRRGTAEAMGGAFGITADESVHASFMVIGSVDQIVEDLQCRREALGVSYVVFGEGWEPMAPVVDRLAGT